MRLKKLWQERNLIHLLKLREELLLTSQAQSLMVSSKVAWDMEKVRWAGQMELITKETGSIIRHVDRVRSSTRLAIRTMANGPIIKQTNSEFTKLLKVPGMKGSGETISNMVMVLRILLVELVTKESIKTDWSKERANTLSQMVQYTRVSGPITRFRGTGNRLILMAKFTMANGQIITWMAMEFMSTQTK